MKKVLTIILVTSLIGILVVSCSNDTGEIEALKQQIEAPQQLIIEELQSNKSVPIPTPKPSATPEPTPSASPITSILADSMGSNVNTLQTIDIRSAIYPVMFDYYNNIDILEGCNNDSVLSVFEKHNTQSEDLQDVIYEVLYRYNHKGDFGIYLQDLSTGKTYGINANKTKFYKDTEKEEGYFRAASIIKLYMAVAMCDMLESGYLDWNKPYYDEVSKKTFYIKDSLSQMLSKSDNDSYNFLLRLVGNVELNRIIKEYGFTNCTFYGELDPAIEYSKNNNIARHNTAIIGGRISLVETCGVLEFIYNNRAECEYINFIHDCLINNVKTDRIPTGIDFKYPVANKTGSATTYGVFHDAGIIYCDNPYVLIVFTQNETVTAATWLIRELSEAVTKYMNTRDK